MDKNIKAEFLSLVSDDEFIRIVKESDNPDVLLKDMIREHPENRKSILYAFEFIRINYPDKTKMDSEDFNNILMNIRSYSEKNRKIISRRKFYISNLWKAAVILVIFSVSSFFIYDLARRDSYKRFSENAVVNKGDKAIIVLSDGSSRVLGNNNSLIEYKPDQEKVIIRNESQKEETIQNKPENINVSLNQILVPFGQRHTILLSDGTIVQLNSGSKLVFPAAFSGRTRKVYLKGEGYFKVSENKKVPFIVKTDNIDIKVLGTSFNISAYEDDNYTTAVLVEGKVNISQKNKVFINEEFVLKPGQACFYSVNAQKSEIKDVDVNDFISWKDGLFKFKDMALQDIVRRVKKFYNVSIQIEGDELANTMMSGKLVISEDINEVMQYLSKTMEGRYEKTQNGIYVLKQK